jgi:hypothetical protein
MPRFMTIPCEVEAHRVPESMSERLPIAQWCNGKVISQGIRIYPSDGYPEDVRVGDWIVNDDGDVSSWKDSHFANNFIPVL